MIRGRRGLGLGATMALLSATACWALHGCGGTDEQTEREGLHEALGSSGLVISQVYGGGGNSGAQYRNDFVELFNPGTSAVSLTGWSVQYASAGGSAWSRTDLSGSVQPGHYFLIAEAAGTGGTLNLPTPDATGTLTLSATAGKVALVRTQSSLTCGSSNNCLPNANIADLIGFGSSASSYEGSGPAPAPSNTTADVRASAGCVDTDSNAADFAAGTVTPRNSGSATNACGRGTDAGARDAGGSVDAGTPDAGGSGITLPAPTLAPVHMANLSFGIFGDTRPPSSQTSGYSSALKTIIGSIFTGLQSQGVAFSVSAGDYAFAPSGAGAGLPQYNDFMAARGNYGGKFLPAQGNHECITNTTGNCPVGSYSGLMQDYVNTIVSPSTQQTMPYYSALYLANDGSWSAKVVLVAANAWDSAQNSWLQATLAVKTTYTFVVRHEPSNDTRGPGVTPSESLYQSNYAAGNLTLSITGHTHLVQLPNGTQPYGDAFGATQPYEIIVGNGGAPLDAGNYYGYAVATRRVSDGAVVIQMYKSANSGGTPIVPNTADTLYRFAVNPDGSSNANTNLP
ncbi:MAG: endonuclease/exonuclease/phosphatase [Myxococcaceae bacterium]|nr:endonuclease/exonuclease/phosphatase [Myxococcaceae bacterium]